MFIKLLCVFAVTQALVTATPKKKPSDERITALLVKDNTNGELRFLTGTGTFNQLITQKQDLLEQLRPSSGANNNIRPIVIDLNGGNIETTSPTVTSGNGNNGVLGAVASQTSPIGDLLPQVVGQVVGGNGASSPTSSTSSTSPTASSPTTSSSAKRRRIVRRGNKRRRVNGISNNRRRRRRRPSKQNSKKQFVVVRPQRG